jgi:hypothetical protein
VLVHNCLNNNVSVKSLRGNEFITLRMPERRPSPVINEPRQPISAGLNKSDKRDEDDYHCDHDGGLEPLVPVADREIAEPPCPDRAGHGGCADQQHQRHREAPDQAWKGFGNERFADDGPIPRPSLAPPR